jgi:hypothetical protein
MSTVSQSLQTSRSQDSATAAAAYPSQASHGEPRPPLDCHVGSTPEIGDLVLEQATRERENPMDHPEHRLRIRADPRGEHECEGGDGGDTELDQVQDPGRGSVKAEPVGMLESRSDAVHLRHLTHPLDPLRWMHFPRR